MDLDYTEVFDRLVEYTQRDRDREVAIEAIKRNMRYSKYDIYELLKFNMSHYANFLTKEEIALLMVNEIVTIINEYIKKER